MHDLNIIIMVIYIIHHKSIIDNTMSCVCIKMHANFYIKSASSILAGLLVIIIEYNYIITNWLHQYMYILYTCTDGAY